MVGVIVALVVQTSTALAGTALVLQLCAGPPATRVVLRAQQECWRTIQGTECLMQQVTADLP
jgi:shikimate 5-dehydrogenase